MKRKPKLPKDQMPLLPLVEKYEVWRNDRRPLGREIKASTLRTFRHTINSYEQWLGRTATVADLDPKLVNRWFGDQLKAGRSPRTVHSRRVSLGTIWRFCIRTKLTRVTTDAVRPVWLPALRPVGFTAADVAKLLERAEKYEGVVRRTGLIPRRIFMLSAVSLLWDTGLRSGDVCNIKPTDFEPDKRRVYVTESKTGKSGYLPLRQQTCNYIAECIAAGQQDRERIWPITPWAFGRAVRRLARNAGFEHGGAKMMRRGSASEVERMNPGRGWRFLRHSRPEVFEGFYRDAAITDPDPILPPSPTGVCLKVVGAA